MSLRAVGNARMTTSIVGSRSSDSSTPWTPSRAVRATTRRSTSKGASRQRFRTHQTTPQVRRDGRRERSCRACNQVPSSCARKPETRADSRSRARPQALRCSHRARRRHCRGSRHQGGGATRSTPAVRDCTTCSIPWHRALQGLGRAPCTRERKGDVAHDRATAVCSARPRPPTSAPGSGLRPVIVGSQTSVMAVTVSVAPALEKRLDDGAMGPRTRIRGGGGQGPEPSGCGARRRGCTRGRGGRRRRHSVGGAAVGTRCENLLHGTSTRRSSRPLPRSANPSTSPPTSPSHWASGSCQTDARWSASEPPV